jgi:hypothetical protein
MYIGGTRSINVLKLGVGFFANKKIVNGTTERVADAMISPLKMPAIM